MQGRGEAETRRKGLRSLGFAVIRSLRYAVTCCKRQRARKFRIVDLQIFSWILTTGY